VTRAAARALVIAAAVATHGVGVRADAPPPPSAIAIAAVAGDPRDVTAATLVGPAGQVYGAAAGGWTRTTEGGVASGVVAAARHGDELIAAGAAAPLFRWHDGAWTATPLPVRGAIVLGGGPAPSAAIGAAVFVRGARGWTRVDAPAAPTSLWAASEAQVWIIAGGAVYARRGRAFTRAGTAVATRFATAARAPLALGRGAMLDLAGRRTIAALGHGEIVDAGQVGTATWMLVADDHGAIAIEHHDRTTHEVVTPPLTAAWRWLWTDAAGRVAVAAPTGEVVVLERGAWRRAPVAAAAPAAHAGPGPARSP
jgi:hypothetical protein